MSDAKGHDEHKAKHSGGHGGHGAGGGHGDGEHEGAPEWLISFADNVMLQMGFFVILLAMAMKPPGVESASAETTPGEGEPGPSDAMLDLALSIREAFNNPIDLNSQNPNDQLLVRHKRKRRHAGADQAGAPGRESRVQNVRMAEFTNPGGMVNFDEGSAELSPESRRTVAQLAANLRGGRWVVEVRGNVSAAEAFEDPLHGMSLSYQRALAVARVLAENGLKWEQLRLMACGDNDRAATRVYDTAGQRLNQRVEVLVTDILMRDDDPAGESAAETDPPHDMHETHDAPAPKKTDGAPAPRKAHDAAHPH